jgi:hypothetical protein
MLSTTGQSTVEGGSAVHALFLVVNVASGSAGLLLGPVALLAPKRRGLHTRIGLAYQGAIAGVATSAVALAALAWGRLWWLALIAVATEAAALGGLAARRRRFAGWLPWHVSLMCGSYVSLVTALLVVNWSSALAWILPTVVLSPAIAVLAARAREAERGLRFG